MGIIQQGMQMSLYDVGEEIAEIHAGHKEIASTREILFIFSIFVFILFILYPKAMLHKQVLAEKSNYELTGVYLENMLRLEPENVDLMFAAADASLQNGNYDLAEKLISVLRKSDNMQIAKELELLNYKLLKILIEHSSDPVFIEKRKIEMLNIIYHVSEKKLFDKDNAFIWYRNAMDFSEKELALEFLKPLCEIDDHFALEQCVYMAVQPQNRHMRIQCTKKLIRIDKKESKKWLGILYTFYVEDKDYKNALDTLERLVKIDSGFKEELARMEAVAGNFVKSSNLYISFYENADDYKSKKRYLLEAVRVLVTGEMNDRAVKLAQRYEDNYLKDEEMSTKLIKLYLSMDRLEAAKKLSVKLLKGQGQ